MSGPRPYTIRSNDRVFIVGKTSSGKSYAAQHLIWEELSDVVYYDMTGEESSKLAAPVLTELQQVERALYAEGEDHLTKFVYSPEVPTLGGFERLCELVYEHRNLHLIADELMQVYRQDNSVKPTTDHHLKILTNGRKVGVGMTGATQRPVNVPLETISESEHVLTFRLKLPKDRDRMADICGPTVQDADELDRHHYYYDHDHMMAPDRCTPLP